MHRPTRQTLSAAVIALGLAGGGAAVGAGTYGAFHDSGGTTVVRQVAAPSAQPAKATGSLTVGQIYAAARKGVVTVTVTTQGSSSSSPFPGGGGGGFGQTQQAQGSGFVYDSNGDIVTNQHVVDGADSITVKLWDGSTYKATVVGTDASSDLAVLKIDAPSSKLYPVSLGDSSALGVGDGVVAIGSPFGLAETVTSGIVSALHRQIDSPNGFAISDSIQTDAAINHGNSGGPLLNMQGKVVGVNAQIESDGGGNEGVGFAIPSNTVRSVVSSLISSGKVEHAYLGIGVADANGGARVSQVRSGSPAAKAGLKSGDVITRFAGTSVSSGDDLVSAVNAERPGDAVRVTYTRNGTTHTVTVTLANRPA